MLRFRSLGLKKSPIFLPIFQSQSLGLNLIYNSEMSRYRSFFHTYFWFIWLVRLGQILFGKVQCSVTWLKWMELPKINIKSWKWDFSLSQGISIVVLLFSQTCNSILFSYASIFILCILFSVFLLFVGSLFVHCPHHQK